MANGSFQNFVNNTLGLYCEYSWSQNVSGNYSDVTVSVWVKYYSLDIHSRSGGKVTVNGTTNSFSTSAICNYPSGGGGVTKLTQQTIRVNHNGDGTKTGVGISVSWPAQVTYSGTYYGTLSASTTINLPTIPRASSITSASNITLGNNCNIQWTPASSSFKYKIKFSLGNWNVTTDFISPNTTSTYTYTGYVISGTTTANNTTIYAQLPSSPSGTMTAALTTYDSSGTQIGSTSSKTFTVSIPSSVVPSVGTITLDPVDINSQNILIQGKNKLTISVSECSAGTGSSIKSYTFSGPGISSTTTSTSISGGPVSDTGTLTYTVKVTDQRGRTASKSATITCYEYSAPSFESFNAYRADSSGTADSNGTYLKCTYSIAYADVNNTNSTSVNITYITGDTSKTASVSDGSILINLGNNTSTYKVYAKVTDSYGGASASNAINIFGASRIFNATTDGLGLAIGKMSEKTSSDTNGLFECAFDAKFYRNITINDKTLLDWTHPVGSIYQSTDPTSPATLFGGTWEQLSGRFLIAANSTYSAGSTGGEASHTLTVNEMPSHEGHLVSNDYNGHSDVGTAKGKYLAVSTMSDFGDTGRGWNLAAGNEIYPPGYSRGGGQAHNNMPPYLAVYMWKRTK